MRILDMITSRKIRDGDVEAFENLIDLYKQKVFNYCLRMTNNYYIAEDLAQDVFIKVYQRITTYDSSKSSLSTWIYVICRNTCLNYLRDTKKKTLCEVDPQLLGTVLTPEDLILQEEERQRLLTALNSLSVQDRELIIMTDYLRLKYREVGEIMGIPTGTVKSRLHGIRQKLKKDLGE